MKRNISKLFAVVLSLTLMITSISVYYDRTNAGDISLMAPMGMDIQYTDKEITILWEENQSAVSYNVYRATGKYSEYTKIGSAHTNYYKDTVTDSVYNYYYKVTAVNADNVESEQSEAVAPDIELFGDTINLYSPTDDVSVVVELLHMW